jgi:hypothetical protein
LIGRKCGEKTGPNPSYSFQKGWLLTNKIAAQILLNIMKEKKMHWIVSAGGRRFAKQEVGQGGRDGK